mgnify:CR=1 FL=1
MSNTHTCYCFVCGNKITESASRIKSLETRVKELTVQNIVLHKLTLKQEL